MLGHISRDRFRTYALDGALQYFHPRSGTHVRVRGPQTQHVRRTAPRVVMFGITNACNLACHFCSRDVKRDSRWTVDSAFEVLRDLSDAGVLEVAFGGGEPFVFPGFDALITRLHEETPLVLNVTTNGTRLDASTWAPFAGRLGMVRVSVYNDVVWRRCAELFATTGQRWGANILVDDEACSALPQMLSDLAAAGCHDVSLLGYVGEPTRLLSANGREWLAAIARDCPLPCRVSVCFGAALDVPRLLAGFTNDGDCGAGSDFITVTPDQRVQSCSFQAASFAGATADEILTTWHDQRTALAQPSPRVGCARLTPLPFTPPPVPDIAIWQGFSGNNSGECVMVARFQTVKDAQAYLDELLPGGQEPPGPEQNGPDPLYPPAWEELFKREQVAGAAMQSSERTMPGDLLLAGRNVLAVGYGADDAFPELRALAWKRGAHVLPGGIHAHDPVVMIGAIAARDDADRELLERGASKTGLRSFIHGRTVFVVVPKKSQQRASMTALPTVLLALAEDRPVAAELWWKDLTDGDFIEALQHFGETVPERPRLLILFPWWNAQGKEDARAFAKTLDDQRLTQGSNWLIIDPVHGQKRVAVLAYRREAYVAALNAERVLAKSMFWTPTSMRGEPETSMPPLESLRRAMEAHGIPVRGHTGASWDANDRTISVTLPTTEPGRVLSAADAVAAEYGIRAAPTVTEPYPLRALLRRLHADVV